MTETVPPTTESSAANQQIARAAKIVMLGFVLSNLTGLVRQVMIANIFGTEGEIDAYYAALGLPDMLFALVAGGALASAFIPTLTEFLERNDREGGWKLTSSIANLVTLAMVVFGVVVFIFALPVVEIVLAPDFSPALQQLTADMLRILLLSPILLGLSGLVTGVLQAHQSFLLPSFSSTLYWVGVIIGLLVFVPSMGIYGLAWGTILGTAMHLGVQIPGLLKLPKRKYSFSLGLDMPAVRQVGRLIAPRLLGAAIVQINFLVSINLASGMLEGSLTAFKNAYMVMTMPQVVIAQSISIAALPTFSAQIARGEREGMRSSLASSLRSILLLSIPAMVGLILLRTPVISMLFERGAFDQRSVTLTAWALLWYSAGLVSHSVLEIIVRAFYAMQDTRTPVIIGVGAMSLNVVFSLTLPGLFERIGWLPHGGLALANTLATTIEVIILLYLMRIRLDGLEGRYLLSGIWKSVLAAGGMSALVVSWLGYSAGYSVWLVGIAGILLGGAAYAVILLLLRVEETAAVINLARRMGKRIFP
ncbi:MAG: murein biosynthesis integral membrane protein MurJ [Chloroflexota bacterium]